MSYNGSDDFSAEDNQIPKLPFKEKTAIKYFTFSSENKQIKAENRFFLFNQKIMTHFFK